MSLNGAGFPCQREIRRLSQLILKKSLSGIRRLGFEGEQPLYRRFPTPDAHQAVQKIAPKSSEGFVEVHRSGRPSQSPSSPLLKGEDGATISETQSSYSAIGCLNTQTRARTPDDAREALIRS